MLAERQPDPALPRGADVDSIGAIYEAHAARLCRVISRILLEREATLDCLHDLFVGLPSRLRSFDGRSKLSTWLCAIAVRLACDELRRRRRRRRLERLLFGLLPRESERAELTLIRDERSEQVAAALRAEDPLDRATIVLTSVEGMSYAEAAEVLGITIESLRGRHKRTRSRLALRLALLEEA